VIYSCIASNWPKHRVTQTTVICPHQPSILWALAKATPFLGSSLVCPIDQIETALHLRMGSLFFLICSTTTEAFVFVSYLLTFRSHPLPSLKSAIKESTAKSVIHPQINCAPLRRVITSLLAVMRQKVVVSYLPFYLFATEFLSFRCLLMQISPRL